MMDYYFEHGWSEERGRLRQLEGFFDPHTHADMERVGIRPGWHCLEVGGGGGSIAEWLSWRVGPTGRVVVTDLSTRLLQPLRASNLEVRQHDITKDSLEESSFDLIHARAVMEHIEDRDAALGRMLGALRPGGWLLLESADMGTLLPQAPEHEALYGRVFEALMSVLADRGFDETCGRRLGHDFRRMGLLDVHVEGRVFEWGGPGILTTFYVQTFRKMREAAEDTDRVSDEDLDAFFAMIEDPDFRAFSHVTCAVAGRKP